MIDNTLEKGHPSTLGANVPFARGPHLLLRPESLRVFLSCANYSFCHLNLARITRFKYEKKNEKDSGHSGKMTPSCKWPILNVSKTTIQIQCYKKLNTSGLRHAPFPFPRREK